MARLSCAVSSAWSRAASCLHASPADAPCTGCRSARSAQARYAELSVAPPNMRPPEATRVSAIDHSGCHHEAARAYSRAAPASGDDRSVADNAHTSASSRYELRTDDGLEAVRDSRSLW